MRESERSLWSFDEDLVAWYLVYLIREGCFFSDSLTGIDFFEK